MISYPNPLLSREVMIDEARAHREADRLFSGTSWNVGRGCLIGCGVETVNRRTEAGLEHDDHAGLAAALGIPEPLVQLQDAIFERLGGVAQRSWPERFYTALPQGADVSGVWPLFAAWMLHEIVLPVAGVNRHVVERVARGIESNWAHDNRGTAWDAAWDAGAAAWAASNAAWATLQDAGTVAAYVGIGALDVAWMAAEAAVCADTATAAVAVTGAAADGTGFEDARAAARAVALAAGLAVPQYTVWTRMSDKLCGLMAACGGTVA